MCSASYLSSTPERLASFGAREMQTWGTNPRDTEYVVVFGFRSDRGNVKERIVVGDGSRKLPSWLVVMNRKEIVKRMDSVS